MMSVLKIKDVMTPDRLRALKAMTLSRLPEFLEKVLELPINATAEDIAGIRAALKPAPPRGPGTELKSLLSKVGITSTAGCSCNAKAKTMDEKGIAWCEENVETICDWLQEEATKRKLPFVRLAGKALIHLAIRRAKKGNNK
jgi:hypothetical protein